MRSQPDRFASAVSTSWPIKSRNHCGISPLSAKSCQPHAMKPSRALDEHDALCFEALLVLRQVGIRKRCVTRHTITRVDGDCRTGTGASDDTPARFPTKRSMCRLNVLSSVGRFTWRLSLVTPG